MKKLIIFLLTIIGICIISNNVYAENFYEGEYIDGIYTRSTNQNGSRYQKARFFRRSSDNKEAYCLEPFAVFDTTTNYRNLGNSRGILDNATWDRITKIANFGYLYQNHTDPKWYAITQYMIWKEADKSSSFYFTDTLNGNNIARFDDEINEINSLINHFNTAPYFTKAYAVVGDEITLTDRNGVFSEYFYIRGHDDYVVNGNTITIKNITEGKNSIFFGKNLSNGNAATYYSSTESQDLMTKGNTGTWQYELIVYGTKNSVTIEKTDSYTLSNKPTGEAKIAGTKLGLYNENDELVNEIVLDETGIYKLENLKYGKYYIKEIEAGEGYTINDTKTEFIIDKDTKDLKINLENQVIEKEIIIHKEYGKINNTKSEENVIFEIYNSNNELVQTITTDSNGDAKAKLPYGKYTVKQKSSKDGYHKVDDFVIDINDNNNDYTYNLYDYEIQVPDTRIKEGNIFGIIAILLSLLVPTIKKYVS